MSRPVKVFTLRDFVRESNRIEGIRGVSKNDMAAHETLLAKDILTVPAIVNFAMQVTRGVGRLRERDGMDVRVADHLPPRGGARVVEALGHWLIAHHPAFIGHVHFEKLHPFMDGNGRTGRALWLWRMGGIDNAPLGFLHHFYYQTLQLVPRATPEGRDA